MLLWWLGNPGWGERHRKSLFAVSVVAGLAHRTLPDTFVEFSLVDIDYYTMDIKGNHILLTSKGSGHSSKCAKLTSSRALGDVEEPPSMKPHLMPIQRGLSLKKIYEILEDMDRNPGDYKS